MGNWILEAQIGNGKSVKNTPFPSQGKYTQSDARMYQARLDASNPANEQWYQGDNYASPHGDLTMTYRYDGNHLLGWSHHGPLSPDDIGYLSTNVGNIDAGFGHGGFVLDISTNMGNKRDVCATWHAALDLDNDSSDDEGGAVSREIYP